MEDSRKVQKALTPEGVQSLASYKVSRNQTAPI
uniref:Uncharacterized protein n=1 Tax=uncultured marine bacterium 581 TaxID=257401 RepID=Q6SF92_9BACT|nr:hypothetical protein MBMO_EBAC000-69B03.80 [uncultured marine bacterium 581]